MNSETNQTFFHMPLRITLMDTAKKLVELSTLLPKHTRPVPSSVSPSGHSQWNEPLLLTHRPLVQTPGKTSHSFTSVGETRS